MKTTKKKYILLGSRHLTGNKKTDDLSRFLDDGFFTNSKLYKSCVKVLNKLKN